MRYFTKFESLNLEEKMKNYSKIKEKYDFFHRNIMEVINNNAPIREQTKMEMKRKSNLESQKEYWNRLRQKLFC